MKEYTHYICPILECSSRTFGDQVVIFDDQIVIFDDQIVTFDDQIVIFDAQIVTFGQFFTF